MAADTTARDDDGAAQALLEQTAAALTSIDPQIPASFAAQLYGRTVPEDLRHYGPGDLAMLAARAYGLLKERDPGTPKIRCATVDLKESRDRRSVGVVEIVNDDMPFLLDSVMGELSERRIAVRLVAHPVLGVERRGAQLASVGGPGAAARESFIHLHVDGLVDEAACADLTKSLEGILAEVRLAVTDWRPMLDRVNDIVADMKNNPPPLPVDELAEAIQFLQWLLADNFTFLGVRNYTLENDELKPDFDSALGIMRQRELRVLRRGTELLEMTPEIMAFLKEPRPLIIAKANIHARVHRRVYLDYIGIKHFDASGNLLGEQRIVGLFTSTAYTRAAHGIPYLRRKLAAAEARAGFDPGSHSGKAMANVLEHYPRDELFQVDEETLYQNAIAILQLDERPRVRVLPRRDRFDRFVSVLVYVPRERYDSDIRSRIGDYLASIFVGRVSAYYPFFPEGPLVRVHFIIGRSGGAPVEIPRGKLEAEVGNIVRTWTDGLAEALSLVHPADKTRDIFNRYQDAFSAGFRDVYSPTIAAGDIRVIDALSDERPLGVDFHHRLEEEQRAVGLKVWSHKEPLPLSDRVPVLENMGFRVVDERTYHIQPEGHAGAWFHDMLLERRDGQAIALDAGKARLEAAFLMVMRGQAENDGYNALTLIGGLGWRDVALIRTLSRFLRQARVPYSQDYMWATLVKHFAIAADIVALFHARFDPRGDDGRDAKQDEIAKRIDAELEKVDSLDEDRILRLFVNAVQSAIRTNFYQTDKDGQPKAQIAVKFESRKLTELPLPRPLYEIFVYSPRVEGVHLRFGKVARGGIRWSDRPQDFRTEILGLVKAQQVKNAVIVPVGAKGGFVPKLMPKNPTREQFQAEGIATYKLFISTLLDITDNFAADGTLVKPENVVRHEGDDPYLVVAADKGTATFSDIANGLAIEHGYWLGDAFASGGSAGYDHKVMGIT
ncbi:MAG: NAD-glutamate dehydrogenase domain-containing protein, partial [Pseudolabrys sp.]